MVPGGTSTCQGRPGHQQFLVFKSARNMGNAVKNTPIVVGAAKTCCRVLSRIAWLPQCSRYAESPVLAWLPGSSSAKVRVCLLMFNRNMLTISHSDESRGGHAMCVAIQPVSVFWVVTWFDGGYVYISLSTEAWYDFTGFPRESGLRIPRYRIWIQLGDDFFNVPLGSGSHLFCELPGEGGLWIQTGTCSYVSLVEAFGQNSKDFSRRSGLRTARSMVGVFASGVQTYRNLDASVLLSLEEFPTT